MRYLTSWDFLPQYQDDGGESFLLSSAHILLDLFKTGMRKEVQETESLGVSLHTRRQLHIAQYYGVSQDATRQLLISTISSFYSCFWNVLSTMRSQQVWSENDGKQSNELFFKKVSFDGDIIIWKIKSLVAVA